MGKSKKRIFNKNRNDYGSLMTRSNAINVVVESLKSGHFTSDVEHLIGIFGFTREELSEHGLSYEDLKLLPHIC